MYAKELKTLTLLGTPIIATQLSQMGMSVADAVMAGQVSALDLAAVALGGNLYWPTMLFLSGVIMSVTPTVSQLAGAGKIGATGAIARQAIWIAVLGGCAATLFLQFSEQIYQLIGVDPQAIPLASRYLSAASLGLVPILCYTALRNLCEGLSWTRPAMLIAASALIIKIGLNYWFIYGGFGLAALGSEGCGWSTAIVTWYQVGAMVIVVTKSRIAASAVFSQFAWPHWATLKRLLNIGLPIGASLFFEMAMFSIVTLLVSRLGYQAVAAHQIAANIGGITFMVPLALGMAATIRIGVNVGAGDYAAARLSGRVALGASIVVAAVTASTVLLTNDWLASLYTQDSQVRQTAAGLLVLLAMYQLFDNLQVTCIGALRGYKDTRTPMYTALISYWFVGFPIATALGLGFAPLGIPALGVEGFWWGLAIGLAVAAGALLTRLRIVGWSVRKIQTLAQH